VDFRPPRITPESIAAFLMVFVVCAALWYLVRRIEAQRAFYADLTAAHQARQEEVYRHLYARTIVIRMIAHTLGITDDQIVALAGPEAIQVPHPTPLPALPSR
jgi:hypothetical protein